MKKILCLCISLAVLCSLVQSDHHKDSHEEHGHSHPHGKKPWHPHQHGKGHGHHHHPHHHHGSRGNGSLRLYNENAEFAFHLYKYIASQPESQSKNVFFSPLSVSVALAALSLGARGKTHQQLFSGLGFNETELSAEEVNEAFLQILQDLNKKSDIDLSVGTALFMHDTFKPKPEFLESMKKYYQAEGFTADFTKSDQTKDLINNYVKEKTQGKIPQLVDTLDSSAIMYLANFLYFKGKWKIPFDPKETVEGVFHVDNGTTVPVQMMTEAKRFEVFHDHEVSTYVLQLHFNESVSMMLILPEKGLDALETVFCRDLVGKWRRSMKKRHYEVFIPKLTIAKSYEMEKILPGMGFTDMFTPEADFSGIADQKLAVSKVVHKATLDLDEEGSTAAAATGVEIVLMSALINPTLKFDHPFMVIISNHETRSILFMGKVVNPTEK